MVSTSEYPSPDTAKYTTPLAAARVRFLVFTFAPGGSHRIKTSSSTMNLATAARIWITLGLRQKGVLMGSAATGAGSSSITGMIVPFSLNYILVGFEILD